MGADTRGNGRLALIVIAWLGCMIALVVVAVLWLLRSPGAGLALASGLVGGAAVGCCSWAYSRWLAACVELKENPVWTKQSRALLENQFWCVVQEDGAGVLARVSRYYETQAEALKVLQEWRGAGYRFLSISGRYFSDRSEEKLCGRLSTK